VWLTRPGLDDLPAPLRATDEEREVPLQRAILIRHGETAWTLTGQHTGVTDIPLTENGRSHARRLAPLLSNAAFSLVLTSPLKRALETCELVGLGDRATIDVDLMEWRYGEYEGLTTKEIQAKRPGWSIFTDGCPGGESPDQVAARVDRVAARIRAMQGDVALIAHGHLFRVFAARWLRLPPAAGSHFLLDTATVSVLSYYHGVPALRRWNAPLV
jgi:broad specificity phosphatase PhoE